MSKIKSNPVERMFFQYDINTNKSICQITNCKNPIRTGNHSGNLESHIKNFHKEQYISLMNEKEKKNEKYGGNCSITKKLKMNQTGPLDNMIIRNNKNLKQVDLNKTKVIESCVQLVTTNGRPFTLLDDSGFRMIMNPIFDAIGNGFKINSHNIKKHVNEYAENIIKTIKADIDKKLIAVKVDCVTRLNRSIIGVNIQYFKDDQLNIKTIGMTELFNRHTSEYLKEVLIHIFRKFNIENSQVYTITCDNGANIVKMVNILNDTNDLDEIHESETSDESDIEEIVDFISRGTDYLTDSQVNLIISEETEDIDSDRDLSCEDLQNEIAAALNNNVPLTQCVRCSAHTLQLCIENGLKLGAITKLLTKARKVVKILRTQSYAALLKKDNLKQAVLDNSTRWDTTYLMLIRLYELKKFCNDHHQINKDLNISDTNWERFQNLIETLETLYMASKKLQKSNLTLGDFYGIWIQTKHILNKIDTPLSIAIFKNMEHRESKLLENDIFISAIYLDPRYMFLLTDEDKIKAVNHLLKTWNLKESFTSKENTEINLLEQSNSEDEISINEKNYEVDGFEDFLRTNEMNSSQNSLSSMNSSQGSNSLLRTKLEDFKKISRLSYKEDIVNFWSENKNEMPELYELSQILMAVPATQVSVERSFSGLKFILSDLRNSIGGDILENILIIRGNNQ